MRFTITGEVDDAEDVERAKQVLSAYGLYNVESTVEPDDEPSASGGPE